MPALIPFPVSMTHEYILKSLLCERDEQYWMYFGEKELISVNLHRMTLTWTLYLAEPAWFAAVQTYVPASRNSILGIWSVDVEVPFCSVLSSLTHTTPGVGSPIASQWSVTLTPSSTSIVLLDRWVMVGGTETNVSEGITKYGRLYHLL